MPEPTQWPTTASTRRTIADHLVREQKLCPYTVLVPMLCSPVVVLEESNGMLSLSGRSTTVWFPKQMAPDLPRDLRVTSQTVFRLAMHCLTYHDLTVATCYIFSRALEYPECSGTRALSEALSYLRAWPPVVSSAFSCARPDMQLLVTRWYRRWLIRCRSVALIEDCLQKLLTTQWQFKSPSDAFTELHRVFQTYQIMALPVTHRHANVIVNSHGGILISHRDKAFVSLMVCCGASCSLLRSFLNPIVENHPAFTVSKPGDHVLDEIQCEQPP